MDLIICIYVFRYCYIEIMMCFLKSRIKVVFYSKDNSYALFLSAIMSIIMFYAVKLVKK